MRRHAKRGFLNLLCFQDNVAVQSSLRPFRSMGPAHLRRYSTIGLGDNERVNRS